MSHTTHLAAVPTARRSPLEEHRVDQFRRRAHDAVANLSGPEAVEEIVRLYVADTGAMERRMEDAQVEATTAAQDARGRYDMLQQCHASASHGLLHQAKLAAEVSACRGTLEHLRQTVERAHGDEIPAVTVLAALSVEPPAPVYVPTVTGFTASDRFRSGYFAAINGDVSFTFTFVGYALVDHGPGAAGIVEPVFLVDQRPLALSMIESERPIKLQRMLPAVGQLAAV